MAPDIGPYESEKAARAAALAEIPPEPGEVILADTARRELLHRALDESGVEVTAYETRKIAWLGNWEDVTCQVIAGWIRRAYEAGKAAAIEGAVTEWGVRGAGVVQEGLDEAAARDRAAWSGTARVVTREVPPWRLADEPATGETGEGNA